MISIAAQYEVVGKGVAEGYLEESEIRSIVASGLAQLDLDGRRVLVIVPDGAAVYLSSESASFVNGQILVVDGGFLASGVNQ